MDGPTWKTLDAEGLRERLARVKALLVQAAAVGLAQDAARLERMVELAQRHQEEARGQPARRRYR